MNFLAHLVLGKKDSESLAGSVLGDFVRGATKGRFPERLEKSILLHRAIDDFTDDNVYWKKSRARLSEERRRYAGVIVDVFYDHILIKNWKEFSGQSRELDDFISSSYRAILKSKNHIEEGGRRALEIMVKNDWFTRYQSREGMKITFQELAYRTRNSEIMKGSEEELFVNYKDYESDFFEFWPELKAFVKKQKRPTK